MAGSHSDTKTIKREYLKEEKKYPPLYKALLHNDDYTTMEFVVEILMVFFHKSLEEATGIMLNVHYSGIGLCGLYPREIAEAKVDAVTKHARANGFPLKITMEKAS